MGPRPSQEQWRWPRGQGQLEWNPGMEPKGPAAPALAPSPKTSVITSMKGPAALALAPSPKTAVIANMFANVLEIYDNFSL